MANRCQRCGKWFKESCAYVRKLCLCQICFLKLAKETKARNRMLRKLENQRLENPLVLPNIKV